MQTRWVQLALITLMMVTRFHHFGSVSTPPDASWAVFFLAGLYVGKLCMLPVLLIEAGFIDYFAIELGGVSDWCVTPGYWFLIPTYGVLWFGGRWCRGISEVSRRTSVSIAVALALSTLSAFIISNAGFYLFSERFLELDWIEYSSRVAAYLVQYFNSTTLYAVLAFLIHGAWHVLFQPAGRSKELNSHC